MPSNLKLQIVALFHCVILSSAVHSQQEPAFSMPWKVLSVQNPSLTATNENTVISQTGRILWPNILDPAYTSVSAFEQKIEKISSAVGLNYTYDQIGSIMRFHEIRLNYSYELKFQAHILSCGLAPTFSIKRAKFRNAISFTPLDPDLISSSPIRQPGIDFDLGMSYEFKDLLVGLSSSQVLQTNFDKVLYQNARHLFAFLQYELELNSNLKFVPRSLYKTDMVSQALDIYANFETNKGLSLGLGHGFQKNISFNLGYRFQNGFELNYATEYFYSQLNDIAIELNLRYFIKSD